ncbi:hypothetical protein SYK_30430 [Pseudodesulfovibrio nedwellii]|uniref:Uncharacterized protein n=1 Tax=Pseudodesulfovibrio nedwellii TaxID=2973072 RepID=A0ABM8B4E8_9BACT|nr:hypothetical protein SYK_30430 [Pseudodesulfovibrio nedwellii]
MRFSHNHSSAANATSPMPFDGLGFAADNVHAAAQEMVLTPLCHRDRSGTNLPAPDQITQPSGYELLVTLGCEIRGR